MSVQATGSFSSLKVVDELRVLSETAYFDGDIQADNIIVNGIVVDGDVQVDSLILTDIGTNNTITLSAPTLASDYALTLPVDDGNVGEVLSTNGTGTLSWVTVGGGGGTPGGATTQIQFNDAGSFEGAASLTFDNTTATEPVFSYGGDATSVEVTFEMGNGASSANSNVNIGTGGSNVNMNIGAGSSCTNIYVNGTGGFSLNASDTLNVYGGAGDITIAGFEAGYGVTVCHEGGDGTVMLGTLSSTGINHGSNTVVRGQNSSNVAGAGHVLISGGTGTGAFGASGGNVVITAGTTVSGDFGEVRINTNSIDTVFSEGGVAFTKGTVTQITSLSTGVILNTKQGIITTVSATTAGQSATSFTVTNSTVSASNMILANILDYSGTAGTNGFPNVYVDDIGSGSFVVTIMNSHGTNALSGVLKIGFIAL